MNLYEEYASTILYEQISLEQLNVELLEELEPKYGVVLETSSTNLFISRKLEVKRVLRFETVMEKLNEFSLIDSFGTEIYCDNADNIIDYVKGFIEE